MILVQGIEIAGEFVNEVYLIYIQADSYLPGCFLGVIVLHMALHRETLAGTTQCHNFRAQYTCV